MDPIAVATGATIALVSAVVIPFLTAEYSLRSAQRTAIINARRTALDQMEETQAHAETTALNEFPGAGLQYERAVTNNAERMAASKRFYAQFSLTDRDVYQVAHLHPRPREARLIISSWANGQNVRARRAAKKLLKEHAQQSERAPERERAEQANSVPNQQRPGG